MTVRLYYYSATSRRKLLMNNAEGTPTEKNILQNILIHCTNIEMHR